MKEFRVTTKGPIVEEGNCWHPKVYRPGELPERFMNSKYGHYVGDEPVASMVINDPLPPDDYTPPNVDLDARMEEKIDFALININQSDAEGMKIDGLINTNIASKIVAERDKNGAYADFRNLLDRIPTLAAKATSLEERFSFEN